MKRTVMDKKILLLTDQCDQFDTTLASALQPFFSLEKYIVADTIDTGPILSSGTGSPDCILVTGPVLDGLNNSIITSLSELNLSVPILILLPSADPELLIKLLNNRLFNYLILPFSIKEFLSKIDATISQHAIMGFSKSSFFSHPYFNEFRHEILNHITIAKGYMDVLCTSLSEKNGRIYCEKISESIRKIQSTLQNQT
jgi:DNA-binding response OmpR family regulator